MTRRNFAQAAALTAASYQRILGANDRIRLGAIGTGGRCQYLMRLANQAGGCEFAAISDVYPLHMTKAKATLAPAAREVPDFRQILDDKDIDALIIGSPDHWHVPMLLAAVAAGKDTYIEKPLTHSIEEGALAIDAVKKSGRVVQVGYQQRSYPHIIEARQLVQNGELGHVPLVQSYWYQNYNRPLHATESGLEGIDWKAWLGTATPREPDELRYRRWRWFWDYGNGTLTDLYSHWVDTIHWVMDDYEPVTAQATGGTTHFKDWECPDTLSASYRYSKGFVSTYDSTLVQSYEDGGMVFRGDKATLRLDRNGYSLYTEEDVRTQKTVRPPAARTVAATGDGTLNHMQNFLACVRSRQTPASDVVSAVAAANAAHLGNRAYKTGETVLVKARHSDWRPLWNGRDLSDFIVDTASCWSARDGVITGRHDGLKYNDFLRTRQHYDNFELKLEFRLKNGEGNTGIQFRSEPVPDSHEVSGYQADIGQQYWGALYDESRRKKVLVTPPALALSAIDKSGWNRYVVRAEGNFISLHLNGIRTVHYVESEPGLLRRGFIALQVHSGPPIQVEFQGIMIREL
jgi:predicted dehydrogenase